VQVVRYEADGWGVGEVCTRDGRLLYHELPWRRPPEGSPNGPQGMVGIPVVSVSRKDVRVGDDFASEVARRLAAYFEAEPETFDDLQLDLTGYTSFQRDLTAALRSVPRGDTVTYGELAALAGRPNAPRAAGSFCAHSRFGIVVPCHRVVAARGLGSYGSFGLDYKRRLLALEGADVAL
jgi:methylated-DNA-[protein]-cysteine S-methyltransferase